MLILGFNACLMISYDAVLKPFRTASQVSNGSARLGCTTQTCTAQTRGSSRSLWAQLLFSCSLITLHLVFPRRRFPQVANREHRQERSCIGGGYVWEELDQLRGSDLGCFNSFLHFSVRTFRKEDRGPERSSPAVKREARFRSVYGFTFTSQICRR